MTVPPPVDAAPRVSFIVPAYNAAETLPATLESLAAQTVADWEAVIVDDGSKDRTSAIAGAAAASDPRLRLVRQANGGASAARNRGIAEARGDYIAFLDSDDWITADFLETMLPLADDGRAIAYCAYRRILPSGRVSPVDWCPELEQDAFAVLVQRCEPAIHCLLIPRPLLLSVGGFDGSLRTCEDWDLWLRLARTGTPFRGTSRALASYRMRAFSLSTEKTGDDAGRVLAIALGPDPRVPSPAPRYAHGWQDAPENRLARALAAECGRLVQGLVPDPEWIVRALGAEWRDQVMADPGDTVTAIEAAAATADPERADELADILLRQVRQLDGWMGDLLADWKDMVRARAGGAERPTRVGRWLAVPADPAALPQTMTPPPGCDALLLVYRSDGVGRRDIALPAIAPVPRERMADALLDAWSLADLARLSGAWRSPRFLRGLAMEAIAAAARHRLSLADRETLRVVVRGATRRALARRLGAAPGTRAEMAQGMGEVPVLMFDRVVPGGASLLAPDIGTRQMADLLELLAGEGYEAIGFDDLVAARAGDEDALPERPMILVFADAASALANDVLAALPPALAHAELLFTPEEIAAGLPARVVGNAAGRRLRAGLRVRRMALPTAQALADAARWRDQLAAQVGSDGPFAAYSDVQGLPDAILRDAGFTLVLSPGSAHARLDVSSAIIPAIECRGSEGIGDTIENLRPAA